MLRYQLQYVQPVRINNCLKRTFVIKVATMKITDDLMQAITCLPLNRHFSWWTKMNGTQRRAMLSPWRAHCMYSGMAKGTSQAEVSEKIRSVALATGLILPVPIACINGLVHFISLPNKPYHGTCFHGLVPGTHVGIWLGWAEHTHHKNTLPWSLLQKSNTMTCGYSQFWQKIWIQSRHNYNVYEECHIVSNNNTATQYLV